MEKDLVHDLYKIGFIGQGWIGKNYANDFESRGFKVVRYSIEPEYIANRDEIKECDIVFICVPTPTTPGGFDLNIVENTIKLVGKGKIAVIKSTIMPGSTERIQSFNPDVFVMHSPEFLTEATAAYDAAHPQRNIIGIPVLNAEYKNKAQDVLSVLPDAPYQVICESKNAEIVKYGGNCWFYVKVVFMNLLYDVASNLGCNWQVIRDSMEADPRIGSTHLDPVHKSGRGAGGDCFVKDMATFIQLYKYTVGDSRGMDVLLANEKKNLELMLSTNKDLHILREVYGEHILEKK